MYMALCLRRVSYLAFSVCYNRSSTCSRYGYERLRYFRPRQCCTSQQTSSTPVDRLLKDFTDSKCKQGESTFQCLSELVKQARKQNSIDELQHDQRFTDHLKPIAQEAHTLSTNAIVSYLRIYSNFHFLSAEHISPLASVLTKRLPHLDLITTSKIAQYLLQFKEGKKFSEPFLTHSTKQYMERISKGSECLNPNTISQHLYALHNSNLWPSPEEREKLQEYILANSSTMTLQSLGYILTVMSKRHNLSFEILQYAANAATRILSGNVSVQSRIYEWGKRYPLELCRLLQIFARYKFYHEEFCDAITQLALGTEDTYLLSPRFLSTLAWSFASVCYYDRSLMDLIAHHSMKSLAMFSNIDLGNLVYGFGQLNHPHPELVHRVVENMFQSPKKLNDSLLCWTVIWSAMVMDICPDLERLLELAITEEFIDYSMQGIGFKPILLLPLSVAVNIEHPELSLATCTSPSSPFLKSKTWGTCIAGFRGVNDSHMRRAMQERILYHSTSAHSFFSANVTRALKLVVGGTHYFNEEPLSLSGYSMDFEVLLNSKSKPITIPVQWKYRQVRTLLKSIDVTETPTSMKFRETKYSLKRNMRDKQEVGSNSDGAREPYNHYNRTILYQIASDWGPRFADTVEPVARKLAIEADGLYHFARNCVHKMGKTTLKHRQLRSLGWEVMSIPQHEWMHLKTGDDHIYYLAKKLNINNV